MRGRSTAIVVPGGDGRVASYFPARRAVKVGPPESLRLE